MHAGREFGVKFAVNQLPTGGLTISMQFGPQSRKRLTLGQNTKSRDFVTLLSGFVLEYSDRLCQINDLSATVTKYN